MGLYSRDSKNPGLLSAAPGETTPGESKKRLPIMTPLTIAEERIISSGLRGMSG